MTQAIAHVALLVRDYGEAIAYFTGCLGFTLGEDVDLGDGELSVRTLCT
jgi:catechol 2,3-dioxygenase-like lactoylglutathione lyase family enzyme